MHLNDKAAPQHIRNRFRTNFLLDIADPTRTDILAIMGSKDYSMNKYHLRCLYDYRIFAHIDLRNEKHAPQNPLRCGLDGLCWNPQLQ